LPLRGPLFLDPWGLLTTLGSNGALGGKRDCTSSKGVPLEAGDEGMEKELLLFMGDLVVSPNGQPKGVQLLSFFSIRFIYLINFHSSLFNRIVLIALIIALPPDTPPLGSSEGAILHPSEVEISWRLDKLVFKLCTELKLESKDEFLNIFIFV